VIKFHYFGKTGLAYTHVITAASTVTKNEDGTGTVKYGVTFSCDSDRYDKQYGKHLAIKRLNSVEHRTTFVDDISFSNICNAIAADIKQHDKNPSWVKDVISQYLN
jgi:hypothetical protein